MRITFSMDNDDNYDDDLETHSYLYEFYIEGKGK